MPPVLKSVQGTKTKIQYLVIQTLPFSQAKLNILPCRVLPFAKLIIALDISALGCQQPYSIIKLQSENET